MPKILFIIFEALAAVRVLEMDQTEIATQAVEKDQGTSDRILESNAAWQGGRSAPSTFMDKSLEPTPASDLSDSVKGAGTVETTQIQDLDLPGDEEEREQQEDAAAAWQAVGYPFRCCCAYENQHLYAAYHVPLVGSTAKGQMNPHLTPVGIPLAVGASGGHKGTPDDAHCPVISEAIEDDGSTKSLCICKTLANVKGALYEAPSRCGGHAINFLLSSQISEVRKNVKRVSTHQISKMGALREQCAAACKPGNSSNFIKVERACPREVDFD